MTRVTLLAATLALAISPNALAQRPSGKAEAKATVIDPCGRLFDPATIEKVSGEIQKIELVAPKGASGAGEIPRRGTHLLLKTPAGSVSVHLGPEWFIANQAERLRPEDKVEVTGSHVTIEGKPSLIATEVVIGDRVLKLRDEHGVPVWIAWQRRQVAAPIDCPLRKSGVDPHRLRPFDQVEKYFEFLERPERASWQKPDQILAALGLKGTEKLVDLGAGSGYFTFRFAAALPGGKVTAIDVDPEMIRHLHHRSLHEKVANVEAVLAKLDDPLVPADADLVFACDVIHHVQGRDAWLRRVFDEMKPGARLVVVDFKEGPLPEGPPENVKVPKAALLKMLQQAGFVLHSDREDLLPYQTFLTFLRPERKASMSEITYRPIGIIHSGFTKQEGTPVQSVFGGDAKGWLELDPAYAPALKDLDGFERIWVLYHLDRAAAYRPLVLPYLDNAQHGLFSTRSPPRPNPIGISTLRVVSIEGSRVNVGGMDILDGTPLLDIKPYIPEFDAFTPSRAGWFDKAPKQNRSADSRFEANR